MNQNLTYSSYGADPRAGTGGGPGSQPQAPSALSFHPSFHSTSTYATSTTPFSHNTSSSFQLNSSDYKMPSGISTSQPQAMRLANSGESDDRRIAALLDSYFIDTPSATWNQQNAPSLAGQASQPVSSANYGNSSGPGTLTVTTKGAAKLMTPEKRDKERLKRIKQAEAARMRYHRLTSEQKKELNMKRTLAQKRKRQREKELEELEAILRQSNDIQEDPEVTDQLRERRMRAKWAEAARARYQRMSSEERRAHNNKRRMRQMQNAINATKEERAASLLALQAEGLTTGDPVKDEEAIRRHIKEQNQKKAEAARQRYHRMTEEEKRAYNQRRTEAFRRRRMEEEMLLAMPIGRINGEALDRAQQIVVRNAKRAEAARLRYQRMTPDQRKVYNQKRYTPKRKRLEGGPPGPPPMAPLQDPAMMGLGQPGTSGLVAPKKGQEEEVDALTTIERDVIKRTQQAQQTLARRSYGGMASQMMKRAPANDYSRLGETETLSSALSSTPVSAGGALSAHLGVSGGIASGLGVSQLQQPSLHHVQPQQMGYAGAQQGLMGHMQPILNPYGSRP